MSPVPPLFRALRSGIFFALLSAGVTAGAGTVVPDGTILPAELNTTLSSKKMKVGQPITARIMQDVPLPGDAKIPAGATLVGQVTALQQPSGSGGGSISFRFDTLRLAHENIRLASHLRALASFTEVRHAEAPLDSSLPENAWTTVQIGGDTVYRGGGLVRNRSGVVGKPVEHGVLGRLDSNPGRGCRRDGTGERAQALWLFSSDACGVYGLEELSIARSDRDAASPSDEIALRAAKGDVNVHSGSGLLLRVDAPGNAGS